MGDLADPDIEESQGLISIGQIAGVVNQTDVERLRKLIFRITRGTALTYFSPLEEDEDDPNALEETTRRKSKVVYIIISTHGSAMTEKLSKVCDSMNESQRFEVPAFNRVREEIEKGLVEIEEAKLIVKRTKNVLRQSLIDFD